MDFIPTDNKIKQTLKNIQNLNCPVELNTEAVTKLTWCSCFQTLGQNLIKFKELNAA